MVETGHGYVLLVGTCYIVFKKLNDSFKQAQNFNI